MASRARSPRSHSPKRRRKGGAGTGNVVGIVLIFLVVALVVGVASWMVWLRHARANVDPETFCPYEGPAAVTAVLLDVTDRYDATHVAAVRQRVLDARDGTPKSGALELFLLSQNADEGHARPLVRLCQPGSRTEASLWTENPDAVERRWRDAFADPIDRALSDAVTGGGAASTPLLEGLRRVAVESFTGAAREGIPRHLIVVSDLLQHSDCFSFYREPAIDAAGALSRSCVRDLLPRLDGVTIEVRLLGRTGGPGSVRDRVLFWRDLLVEAGGDVELVERF